MRDRPGRVHKFRLNKLINLDFSPKRAHDSCARKASTKRTGLNFSPRPEPRGPVARSRTLSGEGTIMQRPGFLQGDAPTRLVHGAIVGILATVILGFGWGGWTLEKSAREMANESARIAVVAALA